MATRTLAEMKAARGGHCFNCRKDISDPSEKDHSFCNECWAKMMAHPYEPYQPTEDSPVQCGICDEPKNDPIHEVTSDGL